MKTNAASIRAATEKDLQQILDIYNDAIVNTTAVYQYKPQTLSDREKWFRDKKSSKLPVLVSTENDSITGFATYGPFRAWPAYKYSVEHSVYVHPAHRRKGIAKELLRKLINLAENNSVHTIIAGIDANNAISIDLHRQLGFVEVGQLKEVGFKFNTWLDLKFLQLILRTPKNPNEDE